MSSYTNRVGDVVVTGYTDLSSRQREILQALAILGTSEIRQIEVLKTECAVLGHAYFFMHSNCCICGRQRWFFSSAKNEDRPA